MDKDLQVEDFQNILRKRYLKGPNFRIDPEKNIGINRYSGSQDVAYYELYGDKQVFRILICKLPSYLHTNNYIGNQHLMLMSEKNEQMVGGTVVLKEDMSEEFSRIFSNHLSSKGITDLQNLWCNFVYRHYFNEIDSNENKQL